MNTPALDMQITFLRSAVNELAARLAAVEERLPPPKLPTPVSCKVCCAALYDDAVKTGYCTHHEPPAPAKEKPPSKFEVLLCTSDDTWAVYTSDREGKVTRGITEQQARELAARLDEVLQEVRA